MAPSPHESSGSTSSRVWPLLLWAAGLLIVFGPGILTGFDRILGGLGDVRLINFTLEHSYGWLTGEALHRDFWSPPIFYPHRGAAAYTDVLLGVAPIYWLLRGVARLPPDLAFHLWVLAIWSLNFVAFRWLLRRSFGLGEIGASAGALLFAFGGWRQLNVNHQQLIPSFFLIVAIVALMELFGDGAEDRGPRRSAGWIALFGAMLVLQAWTAFYPLYFFALVLGAATVWGLALPTARRRLLRQLRRHAAVWTAVAIVAVALVAPLALRYLDAAAEVGLRGYPQANVPRPASWWLMGRTNLVYGFLQHPDGPFHSLRRSGHSNGAGLLTTGVALAGLWRLRRRPGVALTVLSVATLVLLVTSWSGGWSAWRWAHAYLPGAAALRAVGRIGMILLVPLGIGVGGFFDRRRLGRRGIAITALLALGCAVEQLHAVTWRDRDELRSHIAGIVERVPPDCEAFLLVSSGWPRYPYTDEDAAWVALATGVPTVNGRYGNTPPGWGLDSTHLDGPRRRRQLERKLDRWVERHDLDPEALCWVEITRFPQRVGIERRD